MNKKLLSFFTLCSSLSTLVCCALPALFVSLGLGATFVSVLGAVPQLIWLSEHKALVFGVAGVLLVISYSINRASESKSCPIEPELAASCKNAKQFSKIVLQFSIVVYGIGAFFAFIAPLLFV